MTQSQGGETMPKDRFEDLVYIPPELEVFEASELMEKLGPAISCSGYGGAASGCN